MGAKKLTPEDRDEIARLRSRGCGVREIARQVRRSPSTVSHELEAGSWHDSNVHAVTYVAIHAQSLRNKRAKRSGKQPKLTLPKSMLFERMMYAIEEIFILLLVLMAG